VKYLCYQCEFQATQKSKLNKHIQSKHKESQSKTNSTSLLHI